MEFTYMSLGAGVQSSTLAEMIAEGELPPVDAAIFADTGDEPDYVYRHVDYLRPRLAAVGVPLVTVTAGNIVADVQSATRRFAAMPLFTVVQHDKQGRIGRMKRQCTREYKVDPIERWIRNRLLELGRAKQARNGAIRINRGVRVSALLGLSLDEVVRMKPNPRPWIENHWPLIERRMSRHDCVRWLQARALPVPQKSACRVCPYHNDNYWRDMRDNRPDDWSHVVAFDEFLRNGDSHLAATAHGELFIHRQCVPLANVDLSTPQDHGQLELFDICDDGYCFV